MQDLLGKLDSLRRPGLLIQAARLGVTEYRRDVHLRRLLDSSRLPRSGEALFQLMEIEQDMNTQRTRRAAGYSVSRHVDLIIAMMGEARILRNSFRSDR